MVAQALTVRGAQCVQRIATPCTVVGGRKRYTGAVVGDIVAIWQHGQGILCECKARRVRGHWRKPVPSDFEPHQILALKRWHACGGSALVGWLSDSGIVIEPAIDIFTKSETNNP